MRAIMISIKPEWCRKILNKEKTIEIRKTMPKSELPIKVYIYCTKIKDKKRYTDEVDIPLETGMYMGNGRVIAEFTLNEIEDFSKWGYDYGALVRHLDLFAGTKGDYPFLNNYLKWEKKGYAWHIDELKIYDEPKELSEFSTTLHRMKGKQYRLTSHLLQRPPQSWFYVEELKGE